MQQASGVPSGQTSNCYTGPSLLALALLAGIPTLAYAQAATTQVPAILPATAAASPSVSDATAPSDHPTVGPAATPRTTATAAASVPTTMPPPIRLPGPAARLDVKEQRAVALARRWRNRREMPQRGEDGYVRFLFGATLPTVICAPLQVCNLALQPGEIVNNVNIGDSVRWKITPSISGDGGGQTTHLIIKPTDAGLVSSLDIETNRRTYAIKLVSTESEWMPLVAFNYPDEMQRQWSEYRQAVAFGAAATTLPTGENVANPDFGFRISGGNPGWKPLRVYTDGVRTYIEFPRTIGSTSAPALVALANDGGWFSRASTQLVNYRMQGNRFVVDSVLSRAELISGVGGDQTRVVITRDGAR